jgi:hydroxyacylglutathione hydrolase
VVIHCQGGDRAAIAYSLLYRDGYKNVRNFSGGMNEWTGKGNPVETQN